MMPDPVWSLIGVPHPAERTAVGVDTIGETENGGAGAGAGVHVGRRRPRRVLCEEEKEQGGEEDGASSEVSVAESAFAE